jgi:hypothetical protein
MALTILLSAGMSTHSANTQVYSSAADRTMCVWDGRTRECLRILRSGHSSYIRGLSPMRTFWRGHLMWSFSGDKTMRCALSRAARSRAVCVAIHTCARPHMRTHAFNARKRTKRWTRDACVRQERVPLCPTHLQTCDRCEYPFTSTHCHSHVRQCVLVRMCDRACMHDAELSCARWCAGCGQWTAVPMAS